MKISKPEDIGSGSELVEKVVSQFEKQLKNQDPNQDEFHLVIVGEYPRRVLDEVQKLYSEAGWKNVRCRTSSENGEMGGLTGLLLERL